MGIPISTRVRPLNQTHPNPLTSLSSLHWPLHSAAVVVPRSHFLFLVGGFEARRLDLQRQQLLHGQGHPAACSCCSRTPSPPSVRSDDSPKLCGTACVKRRASGAPPPRPPAWPTTRPRPRRRRPVARRCSRPAGSTRCHGPPPAASAGQETETRPRPATSASLSTIQRSHQDQLSKCYLARHS